MGPPTWSPGGRILFNASRVYYAPDEPSLPPLRWMPEGQRFEYLSKTNDEDIALRASLRELAEARSQLYQLPSIQQQLPTSSLSGYLPCEAIYGILPLGSASNSALLYVSEKDFVCTINVGGASHDIFAVRALQWLLLPCATSALSGRQRGARRSRNRRASPRNRSEANGASSDGRDGAGRHRGSPRRSPDGATSEDEGEEEMSEDERDEEEEEDEEAEESSSNVMGRLPTKTLNAYLDVLKRFCESVSAAGVSGYTSAAATATVAAVEEISRLPGITAPPGRFSYLYYSPTLDLSADPLHLLALLTHSPHPHAGDHGNGSAAGAPGRGLSETTNESLSSCPHRDSSGTTTDSSEQHARQTRRGGNGSGAGHAWGELRAAAVNRQLYQWNGPLLGDSFAVPSLAALRDESPGADGTTAEVEAPRQPWSCVCADELWREELARRYPRGGSGGACPGVAAAGGCASASGLSSLPLYVPSFIRGLVAQAEASTALHMTLVTRMCCRWAGTRYNRRGLEPGHSGVVANMAMSSLWVTPRASGKVNAAVDANHFAVYTAMRGSVPRRWEQPANLALKPAIKIAATGNAAEELGRHVRLLKLSIPHLQTLYCFDTMSLSKLEEPLSEAYAAGVRRYNEEAPSTTGKPSLSATLTGSGSTTTAGDDRDGAAAAVAGEDGAAAAALRDPNVTLVKYNVKKALKRLGYAEMLLECTAQLDSAAGAETWVDFTRGEARAPVLDEADAEAAAALSAERRSGSQSCDSPPGLEGDTKAAAVTSTTGATRLVLSNVQTCLVRVNCLDCLDRTNLVQSMLFCAVLPHMMAYVEGKGNGGEAVSKDPAFAKASLRLRQLLASQGTAISQLYAGTEPHFVPFMLYGHHHWTHSAVEGALAMRRWYQQNFYDGEKQDGVALVTRQHDPQVFNADIESPFSRDLRGMNQQVLYGLLLGVLPFLYSAVVCVMERSFASSVFQLHLGVGLFWLVYLFVLYNKLMRYRTTYTNRPLLLYTRQADWC